MDWNWFFSALSQSSAAIVGIFGAFVFTKIINNQTDFRRRQQKLQELKAQGQQLIDQASCRHIAWYNEETNSSILGYFLDSLEEEITLRTALDYFFSFGFSPYQSPSKIIPKIEEKLEIEKIRRTTPPRPTSSSSSPFPSPYLSIPTVHDPNASRWKHGRMEAERDAIDKVYIDAKRQVYEAKRFLEESEKHPESSFLISISIVIALLLLGIGVIYPLSFLPLKENALYTISLSNLFPTLISMKGVILICISILFSFIMVVFFIINLKLRLKTEDIDELRRLCNIAAYSRYFKFPEEFEAQAKSISTSNQ